LEVSGRYGEIEVLTYEINEGHEKSKEIRPNFETKAEE
jgi:hypothetical protein